MQISDRETSILLGATLMHWGVPFRFVAKRELSEHQQDLVDQASEKIRAARGLQPRSQFHEVPLVDPEIDLLVEIVHNCLDECGNDPVELRLELQTSERQEVETLIARLRYSLRSSASR
jgi:hypothetical protein